MDRFTRGLLLVLAALALLAVSAPAMMGGMMGPAGMGWGPDVGEGWHRGMFWGLGGVAMLAFWGAIIVGLLFLFRMAERGRSGPHHPAVEAPLDILRRRYAAGELTREQFEQMRRDLE